MALGFASAHFLYLLALTLRKLFPNQTRTRNTKGSSTFRFGGFCIISIFPSHMPAYAKVQPSHIMVKKKCTPETGTRGGEQDENRAEFPFLDFFDRT
ncbi:hypothetical protein ASPZODRAFT_1325597 [Penicilliopsis zonata CBS 506.65]|uniref:Secreted protein n=1 Tax=Penicilliopsis zonata CBS 506.65 TaxID=1073090 RepID=A0A1L9SNQ7_9EURO|nr:hypothetical protein ASPZODRAFT_1325597 [Penicilliopsis zonata CBS 506.65]OJJ48820.1 hypothetical protein ASPZODRAFT_1325597 [Penicilliopsis zonata CBS 506.65]